jgi:Sec-independent protein translocase protein TatA
MAILGVLALLVFGEKKLPGVMRQAGKMMRDVQNTSQSFLREMDRAADVSEPVPPIETPAAAELPFEPALPVEPEGAEPEKEAGP